MPQICLSSPSLAEERLKKLGLTFKEYTEEGIWTSGVSNFSTASEDEIKRMVFPNLTDLLNTVEVKSRIGKYSDAYTRTTYRSEEILNGTEVKFAKLDYYHYLSIYCLNFPTTSFPFGIEKVYFSMKRKCKVFVVSINR